MGGRDIYIYILYKKYYFEEYFNFNFVKCILYEDQWNSMNTALVTPRFLCIDFTKLKLKYLLK